MRVLVADDHAYNRELLSIILEDEGHQVVEAVNGIQAVDIYCTDLSIDIVLMDINMPEMDGISATKLIKTHSVERFVPIILLPR
jgi:Response regulator containing a CheY-like receiver domain and a GGDEF domain